jgi:peptidoglycan hydrolase CwlO-like protein
MTRNFLVLLSLAAMLTGCAEIQARRQLQARQEKLEDLQLELRRIEEDIKNLPRLQQEVDELQTRLKKLTRERDRLRRS